LAERPEDVSTRLDKWLWAARFFKTRSLAQQAIEAGRVSLNGVRAKPAKETHIDDVVDVVVGPTKWVVRVRRISDVRGPAGIAQTLYAETEESMLRREAQREHARLYPEPARRGGRPTKRDRRALARAVGEG
jgi:ribosome-associated heat shock protein Hsp15